jgi:hypothetical protein
MIWTLMMLKNTKLFLLGSEASLIVKISERARIQHYLQQKELASNKIQGNMEQQKLLTRLEFA